MNYQLTICLDTAFHDVTKGKLYPSISLKKAGEHVRANFGQSPFVFNIDDIVRVSKVAGYLDFCA